MDCRTQLASMAIDEVDKGDFLMATKILSTSIRLEPDNHELYFERSICHHKLGEYQASLDDANAAIRINSSDYNIHYQRGLALIGLSLFPEAVASFKKAIELRAKQEDSKLSDIFKLLRDATNELNTARRRPVPATNGQTRGESSSNTTTTATSVVRPSTTASLRSINTSGPTNNDPVDSTTDKSPSTRVDQQVDSQAGISEINTVAQNGSSETNSNTNLVAISNRNIQTSCANQVLDDIPIATSRVTSSASQFNTISHQESPSVNLPPSNHHALRDTKSVDNHDLSNIVKQHCNPSKSSTSSSYDWSIRRSERIFLHSTNEPGTSGHHQDVSGPEMSINKFKSGSTPSSISSGKGPQKRPIDHNRNPYRPSRANKSKNGTNSHVDSDIDVDDSQFDNSQYNYDTNANNKRVMVAPSSSMPATSQTPISAKEDSYSSKYKRLRRDRERARRGTSKLCTIKISDLDDLRKSAGFMRVIAPIDGWLYSGRLSLDGSLSNNGLPQYVVKLDGDTSGSSYLFTQSTVLNDVIKEVKVKTVSELRKGARICCYWSRTYKCLSTGVVTSRTFEATKSLVSVKYDNGDLSALPLEDLRLLPPDYPKYMSNCDPLLLAKNGDSGATTSSSNGTNRIVVNGKSSSSTSTATYSKAIVDAIIQKCDDTDLANSAVQEDPSELARSDTRNSATGTEQGRPHGDDLSKINEEIPPTNQTIEFLTREDDNIDHQDDPNDMGETDQQDSNSSLDEDAGRINGGQIVASRASSEENNYGIEYRPWRFEGAPKRTKRNGRTYRDNYLAIRRGSEVIKVGDSAELMPRDESILPFIAKIDGIWANTRGEMRVRVRWYYRLLETEGAPYELKDGENALFETDHFDENDVQSIWRATKILPWTDYSRDHLGHVNKPSDGPKIFYLAGYYDPVRRVKHLRSDVKGSI